MKNRKRTNRHIRQRRIRDSLLLSGSLILFFCMPAYASDTVQGYDYLEEETEEVQADFTDLYEQNHDLVGWLTCGENIDYPVMQLDNEFYLHHDFYGGDSQDGTLFVNEYNLLWPRDWLVLIHGHHMKSGAMFGKLQDYEDYSYLCCHPLIDFRTIYDDTDVFYTPVAGMNASMVESDPSYFFVMEPWYFYEEELRDMRGNAPEDAQKSPHENPDAQTERAAEESEKDTAGEETVPGMAEDLSTAEKEELEKRLAARKQAYLDVFLERSVWDSPADVTVDDELLMLVTCSYYQEDGRFMLLCRKLREEETQESVQQLFIPQQDIIQE